jgi:hypothetical protein
LDTQVSRMAFCFNRATDLLRNLAKQNRETVLARLQASRLSTPDLSGNLRSGMRRLRKPRLDRSRVRSITADSATASLVASCIGFQTTTVSAPVLRRLRQTIGLGK